MRIYNVTRAERWRCWEWGEGAIRSFFAFNFFNSKIFLNVSLFYLNMDLNSKFIYTWIYKNLLKGALINKVLINKKCDIYWNLEKHEKNRTKINVIINKLTTHHFVSDTKKDHDYNDAPLPTMMPLGYLMPVGY